MKIPDRYYRRRYRAPHTNHQDWQGLESPCHILRDAVSFSKNANDRGKTGSTAKVKCRSNAFTWSIPHHMPTIWIRGTIPNT